MSTTDTRDHPVFVRKAGIMIPSVYKDAPFYSDIKGFLTRTQKSYGYSNIQTVNFFHEDDLALTIPRYFPWERFVPTAEVIDRPDEGEVIDITHNITPRNPVQEKAIHYLMTSRSGILQLSPGVGKTVISIYMIAERKRKTLVLVHRDPLSQQWAERLVSFTNLKENDIARLYSTSYEDDLKKPIVIATVQTFLSLLKRKGEEFVNSLHKANFGIFLADEVHTSVGAPTFSMCSLFVPAKYTYGLSATPYRYDGNEDVIRYHLGEVFSDTDTEGTMKAKVMVFLLDYQIDIPKRRKYIHWDGKFQRARYLNLLRKSKPFMELMKTILEKAKDRNTLCVAERIKLIDDLYTLMNSDSKSKFYRDHDIRALEAQHTFSTPGKCRDGVDAPWKDMVIMTSPVSNIEQLSGRVVRSYPGKKNPIVVDLVDVGCRDISRSLFSRLKFYKQKEWDVEFYLVTPPTVKPIERNDALRAIQGSLV